MKTTHLVQVNFFNPILTELNEKGVNTNRLLEQAGLLKFNLTDTNNYVPVKRMHAFFQAINKYESGNENFYSVFGNAIRVKYLDDYGAFTQSAPDLLSAAQLCIRYSHLNYTSQVDGIDIKGKKTKYWIKLTENPVSGYEMAAMFHLGLIIDHIRLACGEDWVPLEIHLPLQHQPDLENLLGSNNEVKMLLNAKEIACVFPTEILSRKVGTAVKFNQNFPLVDLTTRSKVEQLLNSMIPGYAPTIDNMAEFMDMKFRTLQRRLAEESTSYFEVFEQWRFKKALKGLKEENLSIKEMSEILGYQKIQSFHRSFKRWTGHTPTAYRDLLD